MKCLMNFFNGDFSVDEDFFLPPLFLNTDFFPLMDFPLAVSTFRSQDKNSKKSHGERELLRIQPEKGAEDL